MSRTSERQHFDPPTRFVLLEKDADDNEQAHAGLREAIRENTAELKTIGQRLLGVLIALTIAAILLAMNVTVGALQP